MIAWVIYGALLAISLATNAIILTVWWAIKRDPQSAIKSFLEGAGMPARNMAIVFDADGKFEIVPTVEHCADHESHGSITS